MKDRKKLVPIVLLSILLTLFVAHFTQYQWNWKPVKPLDGYYLNAKKIKFSWKDWFSGSYQEAEDQYLNDHFGFRSVFIRLNHQLRFSLFNKIKTAWVTVGKENYLYEETYIKAWYGTDFIGADSIEKRMYKLKALQDTLNNLGGKLMIIFAPGKGSFYPEYIPDNLHTEKTTTNIEIYRQYVEKLQINCIDFHRYFIDNKGKFDYPIYPQYGIHWSHYCSCLAVDSLVHYMEKLNDIKMPHIFWEKINMTQPHYRDRDIADAMNLFFPPRTFDMAYPEVQFEPDSGKIRPSVLVVADSFYGTLFDIGLDSLFSNHHWWYYNKEIYPESYDNWVTTNDINPHEEMLKYDIIILLATDANLPNFGWGFIETNYDIFYGQQKE
jgi:hypothetical protein